MTPFEKAFAKARAEGLKEFTFKGKPYNTKLKEEVEAEASKVETPKFLDPLRRLLSWMNGS